MTGHILLAARPPKDTRPEHPVVGVRTYLTGDWHEQHGLRVVNVCTDTRYQTAGYYASLLAEARGHRVIPSVRTLQDLSRRAIYGGDLEALEAGVAKVLDEDADRLTVRLFFGEPPEGLAALRAFAQGLFEAYPVPILEVELRKKKQWQIRALRPLGLRTLTKPEAEAFYAALDRFLGRRWSPTRRKKTARWDLAILHDPEEELPPSDRNALAAFIRAARRAGIAAELIVREDLPRLAEYDALFIRETTAVDHHTWRFARRAAAEGLVVIDDPDSILRCTNKIYLAELLQRAKVPTPASVVIGKGDLDRAESALGYPMILKVPDGAFSKGVFRVPDRAALESRAAALFEDSELLLAQAYTPTAFDWRVGVLAGEPLYVCRYHMSRGHWQIINHAEKGEAMEGAVDTLAVADAPADVVATAVRAAGLIGDGLYGVDLKQTDQGVLVIEVNDNPSLDAGYEDRILGAGLYDRIVAEFSRRLEAR